jgi:hypothetical protein
MTAVTRMLEAERGDAACTLERVALMGAHCRTCGAEVRWITSPEGKLQILDAEHRVEWVTDEPNRVSVKLIVLVGADGKMRRGYLASATTAGARQIEGFVSHWSTCTTPPPRRRART